MSNPNHAWDYPSSLRLKNFAVGPYKPSYLEELWNSFNKRLNQIHNLEYQNNPEFITETMQQAYEYIVPVIEKKYIYFLSRIEWLWHNTDMQINQDTSFGDSLDEETREQARTALKKEAAQEIQSLYIWYTQQFKAYENNPFSQGLKETCNLYIEMLQGV